MSASTMMHAVNITIASISVQSFYRCTLLLGDTNSFSPQYISFLLSIPTVAPLMVDEGLGISLFSEV